MSYMYGGMILTSRATHVQANVHSLVVLNCFEECSSASRKAQLLRPWTPLLWFGADLYKKYRTDLFDLLQAAVSALIDKLISWVK